MTRSANSPGTPPSGRAGEHGTSAHDCPAWCDFADARLTHPTNHTTTVGGLETTRYPRHRIIAITVESGGADEPLPVLSVSTGAGTSIAAQARLSWHECETLAGLLLDARQRHAS